MFVFVFVFVFDVTELFVLLVFVLFVLVLVVFVLELLVLESVLEFVPVELEPVMLLILIFMSLHVNVATNTSVVSPATSLKFSILNTKVESLSTSYKKSTI